MRQASQKTKIASKQQSEKEKKMGFTISSAARFSSYVAGLCQMCPSFAKTGKYSISDVCGSVQTLQAPLAVLAVIV